MTIPLKRLQTNRPIRLGKAFQDSFDETFTMHLITSGVFVGYVILSIPGEQVYVAPSAITSIVPGPETRNTGKPRKDK